MAEQTLYQKLNGIIPDNETLAEEEFRLQSEIEAKMDTLEALNHTTFEKESQIQLANEARIRIERRLCEIVDLANSRESLYDRFRKFGY